MEKVIKIFHYISFIKYPISLIGMYYFYKPIFFGNANLLESYNYGLIFLGLGIGLDSLKDYEKLTWIDKKVYHKPKIAKYYFIFFGFLVLGLIASGVIGYFTKEDNVIKELSIGFIIFGFGALSVLKSGILATKDFMESENILPQ